MSSNGWKKWRWEGEEEGDKIWAEFTGGQGKKDGNFCRGGREELVRNRNRGDFSGPGLVGRGRVGKVSSLVCGLWRRRKIPDLGGFAKATDRRGES